MKSKKILLSFLILFIIIFMIGLSCANTNNLKISCLGFNYIILIFLVNFFTIFICLLLTPTGISYIIILKIIFTIGYSSKTALIPLYIYLPISLIHGIFEITCIYIVYKLTTLYWINYLSKNNNKYEVFLNLLKKTYLKYLPFICLLLVIGAILEVMVSNKLINYLI